MTIHRPQTVLAILQEEPDMRLYRYQHRHTARVLYALFPRGQYDDMAHAPNVLGAVLLYQHGRWTDAGARWLTAHQPPTPTTQEDTDHA